MRRTEYRAGTLADTAVYNRALSAAVAVAIAAAAFGLMPAVTADAAGTTPNVPCVIGASGAWGNVTNGVIIGGVCVPTQSAESPQTPDGTVRTSTTIDCGIPGNTENISSGHRAWLRRLRAKVKPHCEHCWLE